jgi:PPOX class probable F420-dependent enzyme
LATLTAEQEEFLRQPFYGVVTTIRSDGSPHSTVVWVDAEDGLPTFNTAKHRAKAKHLERDPHVGMTVIDSGSAYKWLAIDGRAEVTTDDAEDQIDRFAKKYDGSDGYQGRTPEMVRIKVLIHPEHVTAYGFD